MRGNLEEYKCYVYDFLSERLSKAIDRVYYGTKHPFYNTKQITSHDFARIRRYTKYFNIFTKLNKDNKMDTKAKVDLVKDLIVYLLNNDYKQQTVIYPLIDAEYE